MNMKISYSAQLHAYRVVHHVSKNCATFIFRITSWNIGQFW